MTCPMCGNLREFCSDPNSKVHPQRHICFVSRDQAAADHKYGEKHKDKPYTDRLMTRWSEKATPTTPYHFRDGVRIYGADYDVNPDDHFI